MYWTKQHELYATHVLLLSFLLWCVEDWNFHCKRKYNNSISIKIIIAKCKSSWWFFNLNWFVNILNKIKKLNIGNSIVIDNIKIWVSVYKIFDKSLDETKPPDDTTVIAKLKQSKSLIPVELYKNKIKIVDKE